MRRVGCTFVAVAALLLVPGGTALASGGGGCSGPVTDRPAPEVKIKNFCFDPLVVRVHEGDEVAWTNLDNVKHSVFGGPIWGSNTLGGGARTTVRFDRAGVFAYMCAFHPGMMGTVVVGDGYSGPEIRGEDAGIDVTSFERRGSVESGAFSDAAAAAPEPMEVVTAETAPIADVRERSSLWGPVIALLVILALCLFALLTSRSPRSDKKETDDILRK